jgi:hypothetical protein
VVTDPLALVVRPAYALAEEFRAAVVRARSVRPDLPPLRLVAMPYFSRSPIHPAVAELIEVLRTTPDQRPSVSP